MSTAFFAGGGDGGGKLWRGAKAAAFYWAKRTSCDCDETQADCSLSSVQGANCKLLHGKEARTICASESRATMRMMTANGREGPAAQLALAPARLIPQHSMAAHSTQSPLWPHSSRMASDGRSMYTMHGPCPSATEVSSYAPEWLNSSCRKELRCAGWRISCIGRVGQFL
jgi:hypothetical protein